MKLSDLPIEAQRQLLAKAGIDEKPKRNRAGSSPAFRGACQCGAVFDGGRGRANWEKHSDETGHRRFVCDIAPRSVP